MNKEIDLEEGADPGPRHRNRDGRCHTSPIQSLPGKVLVGLVLCLALEYRAHFRQSLSLLRVDLWICEVELLHRFHNRGGDNKPRKPLVIGGHYEPRGVLGCRGANRFLVCTHVVAPELTFVHIRS